MAKNLSNNGIVLNQTIYPQHVSQSVDAFTGADAYDITVSGSFTVTGSTAIKGDVNVDGPITMYGNVVAPNLTSTAQSNVVTFNPINGQLYYTASNAISPATASNAVSASYSATASYAEYAVSASYADTASWAINAITASYVTTAQTASYVLNAVSASYASTASYVTNAQTASYVENAQTASYVTTAQTASYVTLAQTASYVTTSQTASYYDETDPVFVAKSASLATTGSNTFSGSQDISGSIHQQGVFYPDVIDWFSSSIQYTTGSYILTTTVDGVTTYANYQDVATQLGDYLVTTTSFNSYTGSNTSQFAGTASYATTASYAVSSSAADSAISASYSTTASFAQNTPSASTAVSASHADLADTASYAIFASSSLIANTLDKQDYLLYKNTYFANEGVKDISTALTELGSSQGSVLYIGPGAYSGTDLSITTPNISLNAPEAGAGPGSTITQLSGTRGVTISGASNIRTRLNNLQLGTNGLTISGTLGRHRIYNCQLPQIVFTGATSDFIYFDKCDIGNITIPNTFAGVVYILNSTISGTITNNAPFGSQQLIISNTTGIPTAFTTYYNAGIVYNTSNETLISATRLTASNANLTGSLLGTSSYAIQTATASYVTTAQTASYVTLAQTASYVLSASYATTSSYSNNSTTASYALTASYLEGYISPFPFTGSAQITGSLGVTGSATINGDLVVNGTASFNVFHTIYNSSSIIYASGSTKFGDTSDDTHEFTGSLLVSGSVTADSFTGTASYATQAATASFVTLAQTASYVANAQTASYVANAQTASYVLNAVSSSFAATASYVANAQTASFVTLAQTASYVATASYSNSSLSASYALTASHVTGVVAAFPYTGSAQITGSLSVTGSVNIYKSGSTVLAVSGSTGPLMSITDSISGPLLTVSTGSINILVVDSSLVTTITGSLNVQSGITGSLFGTASWALNSATASFVTTAQTASYVLNAVSSSFASTASFVTTAQTASFVTTAQTASYVLNAVTASYVANAQTASYVLNAVSASYATTASYVENAQTASFVTTAQTASYVLNAVSSSFATTASYVNTASYALNAMSASLATTASYAVNGGVTQLFAGPNITLSPTTGVGQVTISSTGAGTYYNTSTGSYGSFYDTTTQTNPVANVPRSMSLNTTDITNGVSVSGSSSPFNTYIKITNAGVYNIQFSAQLIKTDSGTDFIDIWLRRNGVDLLDSATNVTLKGNNDRQVAAWNWFATAGEGDYYQIMWASADTNTQLLAESATGVHPGIPSVIVTANRIDTFLSNTGSFSGSFNGVLNGTASYATQAATASYVVLAQTASFVTTAQTASYVLNAVSSSFASTASYVNQLNQTVNISGSLFATGSVNIYKSGSSPLVISGSQGTLFEVTDSVSGSLWTIYTGSSAIFDVSSNRVMTLNGSATITGSLTVQNGITGSLFGTASTASFVTTAQTASYVLNAVSSSFASTASFVALAQTASYVVLAQTASYVLNAVSSSFAATASYVNQLNQAVNISGSINATGSVSVYKSGSTVFTVSGSAGPLFDVSDVVSGSLFTVWTGSNRILQANSDYTTILGGASGAAALFATNKTTANSGSTTLYTVPTATYDSIHIDYNIRSGSVARAGNLFAMWSGSDVNQIETSASSFGDTSGFTFGVIVSGSNLALTGSVSTSGWTVKTIIRSI